MIAENLSSLWEGSSGRLGTGCKITLYLLLLRSGFVQIWKILFTTELALYFDNKMK